MVKKKTVFIGLSGGVDSSVSAALLKRAGYEVVGVFIKTWHPEFLECNEEEERRDAMRVAAYLDIPFLTFDFEEEYKKGVADYMIAEYKAGRTPNPDVMCNKEIKFGAFLKKALSMGADYVATGHYAKNSAENIFFGLPGKPTSALKKHFPLQKYYLLRSEDTSKDQVYFLWTLNQEQLSKILFPVGGLKKEAVRKLAKKFGLPVAEKKDSQGICFLGDVDLKEFLKHYIDVKKGEVLNEQGEVVGYHDGAIFYTLGERHGFTITQKTPEDSRYYIVAKDVIKNTITISVDRNFVSKRTDIFLLENSSCSRQSRSQGVSQQIFCLQLEKINWISSTPNENKKYTAQVRYHGEFLNCKIICGSPSSADSAEVVFEKPVLVAPGQSVVIYDGEIVLGGGVVV